MGKKMELTMRDYLKRNLKDLLVQMFLVLVVFAILRFFYWALIETVPYDQGTVIDWFLRFCMGLVVLLFLFFAYLATVDPIRDYYSYQKDLQCAASSTHWTGGLDVVMREFAKALRDNKPRALEHAALILLKEVQVQCSFARNIEAMQGKLEGMCIGLDTNAPENVPVVKLELLVDHHYLTEYLQLTVGTQIYKRRMTEAN